MVRYDYLLMSVLTRIDVGMGGRAGRLFVGRECVDGFGCDSLAAVTFLIECSTVVRRKVERSFSFCNTASNRNVLVQFLVRDPCRILFDGYRSPP